MTQEILFNKTAIIGLGHMGASLGLAIQKTGFIGSIVGFDTNPEHNQIAQSIGAINSAAANLQEAVSDADLVILCTPVGTYGAIMQAIAPHLKEDATLTEIGSIKAQAIRDIMPHLPQHVRFIPAHPIAGSEKAGPQAANGDMYERHLFLITPIDGTPPEWVEPVARLWHGIGAAVDLLTADLHDQIYAYMSHLPQLVAFAAMPVFDSQPITMRADDDMFRRFIRIGRCDPIMWRDIYIENEHNILDAIGNMNAVLTHMRDELLLGGAKEDLSNIDIPVERFCKVLWPRVLASSMIAAVQLLEMQLEMKLAHYAARGFGDMASPIMESSDEDFTDVSNHPSYMIRLIDLYLEQLKDLTDAIENGEGETLLGLLKNCQTAGRKLAALPH